MKTRAMYCLIWMAVFAAGIHAAEVVHRPGSAGQLSVSDAAELTLTIDLRKEKQTLEAFGASDCWSIQFVGQWPDAKRNAIADLLFSRELDSDNNPRGIALSSWRFNLGAGSSRDTQRDTRIRDPWRRADTFLNTSYDGYDWTRLPGQRWFLQAAKERGVQSFTLFTNSPPVNLTKNGLAYCDPSVGTSNLPAENVGAFAQYLADVLVYFREEQGVEFDYVSPFNEPQWDWQDGTQEGSRYSNADIRQAVTALYEELQSRSVATQILIAEAGAIEYLYAIARHPAGNQIDQFFNPSSPNYIGDKIAPIITGHSYWSDTRAWGIVDKREALRRRLDRYPNLAYGMTEYCIMGNDRSGYELVGNGRDLGIDPALRLARTIHYDLTLTDAIMWEWWLGVSPYNYKDGLVYCDRNTDDGSFYESKMLWAMGNFSRFIRPGMKRVQVDRSDQASATETLYRLMVSAYHDDEAQIAVVVFVNWQDQPQSVRVKVQTRDSRASVEQWVPYVTSRDHNLAAHKALTTETINIPARSIVSLTGSYRP